MNILIAAAFSGELAELFARFPRTPISGPADLARLETAATRPWTVSLGMGPDIATRTLDAVLEALRPAPDLIVLTGCCGSMVEGLTAGTLVLPDRLCEVDSGTDLTIASELRGSALALLDALAPITGGLLTSPRVISSSAEKMTLARAHECLVVDMETFPCAALAARRKIPALAIRAVVDRLRDPVPDFPPDFDADGRPRILAAAVNILRRPWVLPGLLLAAPRFSAAQRSIARAIEAIIGGELRIESRVSPTSLR